MSCFTVLTPVFRIVGEGSEHQLYAPLLFGQVVKTWLVYICLVRRLGLVCK